jgi:type IV pilus assembly protein PilX
MRNHALKPIQARQQQRGVVLIVAIIAIVAMTFAVYAMLRSTSGSLGIAGNLAFKQGATSAGDLGVEMARNWLTGQTTPSLNSDQSPGYYSTWGSPPFDPLTYAWNAGTNAVEATADDGSGNRVMYVVHRLCKLTGSFNLPNQECVRPSSLNATSGSSAIGSGGGGAGTSVAVVPRPYFRITTRVEGPRNTLSYVQVIMY